jgi:starvation-inducible DNA-binding protein
MPMTAVDIAPGARAQLIDGLTQCLAEVAIVTTKAQNFHWNVTGMSFGSLHELFQEIYEDHFEAQDELAERIKALEGHAEGRYSEYLKRSAVREHDGHGTAEAMVQALKQDEERVSATLRALADSADKLGDMLTNDIAIVRAEKHEKFAWMLRAHLQPSA